MAEWKKQKVFEDWIPFVFVLCRWWLLGKRSTPLPWWSATKAKGWSNATECQLTWSTHPRWESKSWCVFWMRQLMHRQLSGAYSDCRKAKVPGCRYPCPSPWRGSNKPNLCCPPGNFQGTRCLLPEMCASPPCVPCRPAYILYHRGIGWMLPFPAVRVCARVYVCTYFHVYVYAYVYECV